MAKKRETAAAKKKRLEAEVKESAETTQETPTEELTEVPEEETVDPVEVPEKETVDPVEVPEEETVDPIDMKEVLKDDSLSVKEKLEKIAVGDDLYLRSLAAKLLDFENALGNGIVDNKFGAAKQYDLLTTLTKAIANENTNEVKNVFILITFAYREFGKSAFSQMKLFRFQKEWKWGDDKLSKLNVLHTLFSELCDHSKRTETLKTLSLDNVINEGKFSRLAGNNIKNFFK